MSEQLKAIINQTVRDLIEQSASEKNIQKLTRKHQGKVHFIPIRYRIIGGILQSLNIKFGNFIEQLMRSVVEIDPLVEVMPDSGRKRRLYFTPETDRLIDQYITMRQLPDSPDDCTPQFDQLLEKIIEVESHATQQQRQGIVKDIDGLFRTQDGLIVYIELKYNDDHDTGKFADINRKFIKTWAGLAVQLQITRPNQILPIIYYFNPTKRYGPIHTPARNIMRGPQLFDRFLQTNYADLDHYLSEIGEDPEILALFDAMYNHVRNSKLN